MAGTHMAIAAMARASLDAGEASLDAIAARYATRLIWMQAGRIVADGTPEDTLTEERIQSVYGLASRVDGRTVIIDGAT